MQKGLLDRLKAMVSYDVLVCHWQLSYLLPLNLRLTLADGLWADHRFVIKRLCMRCTMMSLRMGL